MVNDDNQKISRSLKEAIHDLNNIFTSNLASIENLQGLLNDNPTAKKQLTNLSKNSLRAIDIINSLTTNSKTQRTISLKTLLDDVIATAESTLNKNITISLTHKNSFPTVIGYYIDLYRAFLNLTINAIESIDAKGTVEFFVRGNKEEKNVSILIKDSGKGILERDLTTIFDSGFSTKMKNHESGHGLKITKDIIDEHNGNITVSSKKNKGTIFNVTLPTVQLENRKSEKNKNKKILLVDDEKIELLSDLLTSYNYSIVTVDCGEKALEKFRNNSDFSLLIIDKTLPSIDGLELIKNIREQNSDIPIILMSGEYETIEKDLTHLGINKKVKKPFDFEIILNEIQTLLT